MTATADTSSLAAVAAERVKERSAQWLAEVARGDAEGVARYYTEDGSFLVPNAPLARGTEAIRTMWGALLAMPELSLQWAPLSIELASGVDIACEIGTYTLRARAGDASMEDEGKYVVVWRKDRGDWYVYADIFNSSREANAR